MMADPKPIAHRTPISVQRVSVIMVVSIRGEGVIADPVRQVTQFWSDDGDLLAERDPRSSERPTL